MKALAPGRPIEDNELAEFLGDALAEVGSLTERVLAIVPDDTRTIPMPTIFAVLCARLAPRVKELTFLVALGTHPAMTRRQLADHFGRGQPEPSNVRILQHEWRNPAALTTVGEISAAEVERSSRGLQSEAIPVRIHRLAVEADRILIVNPVFPHEVVGFSGGHKYFFPGIGGAEMLDASHWLGALITNPKVNGHKETPVRSLIELASDMISTPRLGLSLVLSGHDVVGAFFGDVRAAWSAAADLSARVNIVWKKRPYHTVISVAPAMYRDLWTAGKCMYKLEPVVADGGTLVVYAPHIEEVSPTHGEWIERVGYHTRDFFLAQGEKYADVPRTVLAHSTHVKGIGTYRSGVERPRIEVVLATGIPETMCRRINLDYRDPASIDVEAFADREDEGVLLVRNAGEQLYRLASGDVPNIERL